MNTKNLLIIVIIILAFIVGFILGKTTSDEDIHLKKVAEEKSDSTSGDNESNSEYEETAVDSSNLTEGQIKLMHSMGIDPNEITVTAEMVACAEAKLGASRIEEIKNGATPSFTEGVSLVACYK